ncbi:MAG: hypothetical protein P8X52_05995 [Limibacillus sp.]
MLGHIGEPTLERQAVAVGDLALGGLIQARDQAKQARLANARRTEQAGGPACFQVEIQSVEERPAAEGEAGAAQS